MKRCSRCLETKDEEAFFYRGGGRKGLQSECLECSRERARTYRQVTRDKVSKYKISLGCQVCGNKNLQACQLDLDHIDPLTKTYKGSHKAYDAGWSWERVEKELAKCLVTCKNCHALRTYEEKHWLNEYTSVRMR